MALSIKQPVLKPQDLVVVLKVAIVGGVSLTFAQMASQLFMSASEVHASVQRAIRSHLLSRTEGDLVANKSSLQEFITHGAKYAFPASVGAMTRGVPTSVSAWPLRQYFEQVDVPPFVWPDPQGEAWGVGFCPLYPSVPSACRQDPRLHEVLAIIDALRGGAARERELAEAALLEYLL